MFLIIDVSSRSALKSSFDGFKNIREACDVLDTFFSVSERARIKETYTICKEKILQVKLQKGLYSNMIM